MKQAKKDTFSIKSYQIIFFFFQLSQKKFAEIENENLKLFTKNTPRFFLNLFLPLCISCNDK